MGKFEAKDPEILSLASSFHRGRRKDLDRRMRLFSDCPHDQSKHAAQKHTPMPQQCSNSPTRDLLLSIHYLIKCPKGLEPHQPRRTQYMHFTLTNITAIHVNKDRVKLTLNFDR